MLSVQNAFLWDIGTGVAILRSGFPFRKSQIFQFLCVIYSRKWTEKEFKWLKQYLEMLENAIRHTNLEDLGSSAASKCVRMVWNRNRHPDLTLFNWMGTVSLMFRFSCPPPKNTCHILPIKNAVLGCSKLDSMVSDRFGMHLADLVVRIHQNAEQECSLRFKEGIANGWSYI